MDKFDLKILNILKDRSDIPLKEIGKLVGIFSPSAVSKRIQNLKEQGYIKKDVSLLDYEKLGYEFQTITLVRTKYGKDYARVIGDKMGKLPNVVAIYFILGDIDFVLITMNRSRSEYLRTMEYLTSIEEIERSDSRVIAYTLKSIDFDALDLTKDHSTGKQETL